MAEIFFIFSIVYLTGSSSYPIRLKLFFEYLNHIRNPAFAVHPCPSPIFCHQEDKSELRGATPHFLPRLSPKPAQEWLPANFTVHSDFSSLFLPYGYFHRLLPLQVDFSTVKAECIIGFTAVIPVATPIPLRLIPAPQASIAAPGSSVQLSANISAIHVFLDGFRLPGIHH